jgi:DNA-binding XRE family transcriptional regulator
MENIFLRYLRETHQLPIETIAATLGITPEAYSEMENGDLLLNIKQARRLGKLYNVKTNYIFQSAAQLDLLLTSGELIKVLKEKLAVGKG